jgi:phage I-like protein
MKRQHRILDGTPIGDIAEAAGEGGNTSWQRLAVVGEWKGHWMGPFSVNAQQIQQMVDSIVGSEIDVVVDYEHATVFSDRAPASGWIKAAKVDQDQNGNPSVLAQIAWTDTAAAHIKAGEYRYLSPVIVWQTRERQTGRDAGTSIQSVALTNVPFLHELPEVRLNSFRSVFQKQSEPEGEPMDEKQFQALCQTLGLDPKTATVAQVMEALGKLQGNATQLDAINQALGVEGEANPVDVANTLRAQATSVDPNELATLRSTVSEMQTQQTNSQALQAVKAAQLEGKVAGDDTDNFKHALAWAQRDLKGFGDYIATLPAFSVAPGHQPQRQGSAATSSSPETFDDPELEAQVQRNCQALGITPEQRKDLQSQDPSTHLRRLWGADDAPPVAQGKE